MAKSSVTANDTRVSLAARCSDTSRRDFTAIALSGGGTKAAVFSGEALFYLQAIGLLQQADVISSVSGGSFAGALYALSCDPDDQPCTQRTRAGLMRPLWQHDTVLKTLGAGYKSLVDEQVARLLIPFVKASISADRFAQVIDQTYLGASSSQARYTFGDLNPRRPHLFMNATILSHNRGGLESVPLSGCTSIARGYLRRRTPDEYFHFAFSDYYFGLLKSSLADYPVASAVAASAAFPALIDNAKLTDYCEDPTGKTGILLMDGGANDNQALIEVYLILSELALHQARSDLSARDPAKLERLGTGDRGWFIVVNSSVTESTGRSDSLTDDAPHSAPGVLLGIVDKVLSATDTYSAIGYDLRRQLYLAISDRLHGMPGAPVVTPVDISLTSLDQYYLGGTEAALRTKSGIGPEPSDPAYARTEEQIKRQSKAYSLVEDTGARHRLHLSDWHPQCYFDMRAELDASLISLSNDNQACLREAARWSAALRAQELCNAASKDASPHGLACDTRSVPVVEEAALMPDQLPGLCKPKLPAPALPGERRDSHVTCRALD